MMQTKFLRTISLALLIGIFLFVGNVHAREGDPEPPAPPAPPAPQAPAAAPAETFEVCVGRAVAKYMNSLCSSGLPANVKLLSPAFNFTNGNVTSGIIDAMTTTENANWGCLAGISGNTYHVKGQPMTAFLGIVDSKFPGKDVYLTEMGIQGARPANFVTMMQDEIKSLKPEVKAALWFNAMNTNGGWGAFSLSDEDAKQIVSAKPGVMGVNFATPYDQPDNSYSKAATLGYKWTLEIAKQSQVDSTVKGINKAYANGMMPIVRIGVGADGGGFEPSDPQNPTAEKYAEFLKAVSAGVGNKQFFAIAGPNEPDLESWLAPLCKYAEQSACGSPMGYQPRAIPGKIYTFQLKGNNECEGEDDCAPKLASYFELEPSKNYPHQRIHNKMAFQYIGIQNVDQYEAEWKPPSFFRAIEPLSGVEAYSSAGIPSAEPRAPGESATSFVTRVDPPESSTLEVRNIKGCIQDVKKTTGIPFFFTGKLDFDLDPSLRDTVRGSKFLQDRIVREPEGKTTASVNQQVANAQEENPFVAATAQAREDPGQGAVWDEVSFTPEKQGKGVYKLDYRYCVYQTPPCGLGDINTKINGTEVNRWNKTARTPDNPTPACLEPTWGGAPVIISPDLSKQKFTVTFDTNGTQVGPNDGTCPQSLFKSCDFWEEKGVLKSSCGSIPARPRQPINCKDYSKWAPECTNVVGASLPIETKCVNGLCKGFGMEEEGADSCSVGRCIKEIVTGGGTSCLKNLKNCVIGRDYTLDVCLPQFVNKYAEITYNTTETLHASVAKIPGTTGNSKAFEKLDGKTSASLTLKMAPEAVGSFTILNPTIPIDVPLGNYGDRHNSFCEMMKLLSVPKWDTVPDDCGPTAPGQYDPGFGGGTYPTPTAPFVKGDSPKIWIALHDELELSDAKLDQAKNFDIAMLMPENEESAQKLGNLNQKQAQLAFTPIWYEQCASGRSTNPRCRHKALIDQNNWYLKNASGAIIQWRGPTNLNTVDMRQTGYPEAVATLWASLLDSSFEGIENDYPSNIDFYIQGEPAGYRDAYQQGMISALSKLKAKRSTVVMGNASIEPKDMQSYTSPFAQANAVDIFMMEDFPCIVGVSCGTPALDQQYGKWGYSAPDGSGFKWSWNEGMHLIHIVRSRGKQVSFINNVLSANDYQLHRFSITTALMVDAYYAHQRTLHELRWYDEFAVDDTGQAVDPNSDAILQYTGWLGRAKGDVIAADNATITLASVAGGPWNELDQHAWIRYFDNGVAIVNPTNRTVSVTLTGNYKHIMGDFGAGNNGEPVGSAIQVPPADGVVLVINKTGITPP